MTKNICFNYKHSNNFLILILIPHYYTFYLYLLESFKIFSFYKMKKMQVKMNKKIRHKIPWHFEIQMDHLFLVLINNNNKREFTVLCCGRPQSRNNRKWKDWQILRLYEKIKKLWNIWVMVIPTVIGALETVHKKLQKDIRRTENQRKNQDHPDNSIVEIGQNI